MTLTLITHAAALIIGIAIGWYGCSKFGSKAAQIVTDVKKL